MVETTQTIFLILKTWWWLFLPLLLYFPARYFYLWWINWEVWYKEQEQLMLELIPPGEIEKPFKAMDDIFSSFWPIVYDAPNWRQRWCEGEIAKGPYWFSAEIVSIEGKIHFYLRIPKGAKKMFESIIHAYYPETEIFEVSDYTQDVPQDIPNKEYDLFGEDYILVRDWTYPIKTYRSFEPSSPEGISGERKIDPINSLMEAMTKIKAGEQVWFQILATPILDSDIPWITKGKELADKLARRPSPPKPKPIVKEVFDVLLKGSKAEESEKQEVFPPEMKLTPGEREIIKAVEEKISKYGFKVSMRSLYVYKKEAYSAPHAAIVRAYFSHFGTQNLNAFFFLQKTRTKIQYLFRDRRLYKRKKDIFRKYVKRFPPSYPNLFGYGSMVLNTEELASIFHFPIKASVLPPGVPRVYVKKGEPPPDIPTE